MDASINRTHPAAIMGQLPLERRIALKSFLKRWHGNPWMKKQYGWLEDASLIASSELNDSIFNPRRILYCAHHGLFCEQINVCRRCCLDRRVQPAVDEYSTCFELAPYWYSAVINTKVRADLAGLHYGKLEHRPFTGKPDGYPLYVCPEQEAVYERLCQALFDLPTFLKNHGIISGAFSHLEFHLSFGIGQSPYDSWSDITHSLKPHVNVLFNAQAPITPDVAVAIYTALGRILMRHHAVLSYPNLYLNPISDQNDLYRWLRYMLKGWPLEEWYRRAIKRGCNPLHLNLLFDEIVFENLNHFARRVVSPRKIGNMNCQTTGTYIGIRPPIKLSGKQITQWLKDPAFAALNPDWEESVYQLMEKRRQRRGQDRNNQ